MMIENMILLDLRLIIKGKDLVLLEDCSFAIWVTWLARC